MVLQNFSELSQFKKPIDRRLAIDEAYVQHLCSNVSQIDYKVTKTNDKNLALVYEITYNIKSIISINIDQSPNFCYGHIVEISLPERYPADYLRSKSLTDTWHPNIRSSKPYKGAIDTGHIPRHSFVATSIIEIGKMLQYKIYFAGEIPYPNDIDVARWVKQYAEPNGIVDIKKGIFVDYTDLDFKYAD